MATGSLGTIWAELGLRLDKFDQNFRAAEAAIQRAETRLAGFEQIGKRLTQVGRDLTMKLTLPIVALAGYSVKAFGDFEDAMTNSLSIAGDVSEKMRDRMEKVARDIAKTTRFSAVQAADAYYYLLSAGLDAERSLAALPVVAKFAAAGKFDLARATSLAADALSALGMASKDANEYMINTTRLTDVLVKGSILANATVDQLSESLTNKAGGALKFVNKSVEEGIAVLSAYAAQGIKGSEAGERLNIVLRDLQTASQKNRETFAAHGIAIYDSAGNMRNMADIVGDLERALAGMSDEQRRATLMQLGFQDRSVAAIMALLGTSDAIREYERELRKAGGTTDEVARKQLESFNAKLDMLKSRLIDKAIIIGERLVPMVERLMDKVEKAADWFGRLDERTVGIIVSLGLFVGAVPPVLWALGEMYLGVVGLAGAKAALSKVITRSLIPALAKAALAAKAFMLTWGPVGLVFLALGAIIAAIWARTEKGMFRIADAAESTSRRTQAASRRMGKDFEELGETAERSSRRASHAIRSIQEAAAEAEQATTRMVDRCEAELERWNRAYGAVTGQMFEPLFEDLRKDDLPGGGGDVFDILEYKLRRLTNQLALLEETSRRAVDVTAALIERKRVLDEVLRTAALRLADLQRQYLAAVAAQGEYAEKTMDLALAIDDLRLAEARWRNELEEVNEALAEQARRLEDAAAAYAQYLSAREGPGAERQAAFQFMMEREAATRAQQLGRELTGEELRALSEQIKARLDLLLPAAVPSFAVGGKVPGPVGMPQLAVVHGGETVLPHGQYAPAPRTITINLNQTITDRQSADYAADEVVRALRKYAGATVA